jgi:hypothetical protein
VAPDGAVACNVKMWVDLVSNIHSPERALSFCSVANSATLMSALIYRPEQATLVDAFTSVVYSDTVDTWATKYMPGSEGPHIEVRDPSGQRTDPFGNPVNRRSPGNHYPYQP